MRKLEEMKQKSFDYAEAIADITNEAELFGQIEMAFQNGWLAGFFRRKDRCPCGGVILADTEDNQTPLCNHCVEQTLEVMK